MGPASLFELLQPFCLLHVRDDAGVARVHRPAAAPNSTSTSTSTSTPTPTPTSTPFATTPACPGSHHHALCPCAEGHSGLTLATLELRQHHTVVVLVNQLHVTLTLAVVVPTAPPILFGVVHYEVIQQVAITSVALPTRVGVAVTVAVAAAATVTVAVAAHVLAPQGPGASDHL